VETESSIGIHELPLVLEFHLAHYDDDHKQPEDKIIVICYKITRDTKLGDIKIIRVCTLAEECEKITGALDHSNDLFIVSTDT